jgi:hypothetical protein
VVYVSLAVDLWMLCTPRSRLSANPPANSGEQSMPRRRLELRCIDWSRGLELELCRSATGRGPFPGTVRLEVGVSNVIEFVPFRGLI